MRILAIYTQPSLSLLRRVQSPFSALAKRGHAFAFLRLAQFTPEFSTSYDVTVMPNWVLRDEELAALRLQAQKHAFVYDLSEPSLLTDPRVQETLSLVRLVTVPNAHLAKEVKNVVHAGSRVAVLPSCVDAPFWLQSAPAPHPKRPLTVGCYGPYDWHLIKEALTAFKEKHPLVFFHGDVGAFAILGDLLDKLAPTDVMALPAFIRSSHVGLCPIEQEYGYDLIVPHEYGIYGIPTLSIPLPPRAETQYDREDRLAQYGQEWQSRLSALLFQPKVRSAASEKAQREAQEHKSTRVCDVYLKTYRQMLPHLLSVR